MKRLSSFFAASILLLLSASVIMAQSRQKMMHHGDGPMGMRMAEQLNLTDTQKEQIQQTMLDTRKKRIDLEAKEKVGRIELHELIATEAPDQAKINAKITDLAKLHELQMRARVESMLAIHKILTPEQRKKAKDLHFFDRFGGGHWGEGMPGRMHGAGLGLRHDDAQL